MARLTRKHRQAIARGVRRYWKRVKTRARADNSSIKDARQKLKIERQEETRKKRRIPPPDRGWASPDPEGEAAFNLEDRDKKTPPPWSPRLAERFRGQAVVKVKGYWEYRASPTDPAEADEFQFEFDPGATDEEFWSYYYEALRDLHDEITSDDRYERLGIYVTRIS
jgi:hypothetical protein